MPNVETLLRDHVTLKVDCVDRLYLNGYVPRFQRPQNVWWFFTKHRGCPMLSPALLKQMTDAVARTDALLRALLAQIAALSPSAAPAPGGEQTERPVVGELMALLLRRDLDAVQWVLGREAALVLQLGAARARALREAVEVLDYAGAVHLLGEVSTP